MEEQQTPSQNSLPQPNKSIITNPTLQGWLAVFGMMLGLYGLYQTFTSSKQARPVYKVLSDVIITDTRNSSRLKMFYDSVEVENVRAVTIALWNAGNHYLDKDAFSKDKPLSIKSKVPVRILEVKPAASTRRGLAFNATIIKSDKVTNYLALAIKGDEGLEESDGTTFQLLYTSSIKGSWFVDAKIKGLPAGIKPANEETKRFSSQTLGLAFLALIPFLSLYYTHRNERSFFDRILLFVFGLVMILTLFIIARNSYNTLTESPIPEVLFK